jgi:hypothetical protein
MSLPSLPSLMPSYTSASSALHPQNGLDFSISSVPSSPSPTTTLHTSDPTATCDEIGDDPTPSSWIRAVCQMQAPSSTLDHSLLAFCAVQVNLSGDSCLSQDETGQVYNHALSKLIEDLDSRQPSSDEMLAAIVALSTCEVCLQTPPIFWE